MVIRRLELILEELELRVTIWIIIKTKITMTFF